MQKNLNNCSKPLCINQTNLKISAGQVFMKILKTKPQDQDWYQDQKIQVQHCYQKTSGPGKGHKRIEAGTNNYGDQDRDQNYWDQYRDQK